MAEHVDNDAAAVFLAIVPGWPLSGNDISVEDPVAEFAAHRENVAKEADLAQGLQLQKSREPEFILHHSMRNAGGFRQVIEIERDIEFVSNRFLAVNVLACGDGFADAFGAAVGGLGVEVDAVSGILQRLIKVGGEWQATAFVRD